MQNFFENKNFNKLNDGHSSNPFAVKNPETDEKKVTLSKKAGKRLNIIDMDVLTNQEANSDERFIELKMDKLHQNIHGNPKNIDPVALEEMKIEWESLRDRLKKIKSEKKEKKANSLRKTISFKSKFSKIMTLFKFYSPKIKKIMNTFDEINKEIEDLVSRSTPVGEEEIKYGLLVNRLYQASKLNGTLTNEIK